MAIIPSMDSLLAFEAAARHLSFLHASVELHLTPGAVSRRIQTLEALLGTALFLRRHRRVALTRAGAAYLAEIRAPMERIGAATDRLAGGRGDGLLSIRAYPSFAIRWFMPRWGRFYDRHPDLDVRLTTSLAPVDFGRDDYDLAIQVLAEGETPAGLVSHEIVAVETAPVAAPEVAARLRRFENLAGATLLHGDPRPSDWSRWLAHAGIEGVDPSAGLRLESLNLVIQAAIEGVGVGIAILALVESDLAAGRLVRPFGPARRSRRSMRLVYPAAKAANPALGAFRDWILSEVEPPEDRCPLFRRDAAE